MQNGKPNLDRRARRHQATKDEIVTAAWEVAREKGLAALTLKDVASRVGMRAPSLYGYFAAKNDIYDAMFAQGNEEFLAFIDERRATLPDSPLDRLRMIFQTFFDFCTADVTRYQLLFQRTIPGFVPSEGSYEKAIAVLTSFRLCLAEVGLVGDQADEDLITALTTGLVDQQISNDPGGNRWGRLLDDAADMAYEYVTNKHAQDSGSKAPAEMGGRLEVTET